MYHLQTARLLLIAASSLAIVSAVGGLFWTGLYRETAWALPQMRGQDLITLILAIALLVVLLRDIQDPRIQLIAIGLSGYLWYTYVGASFAYTLNEFLPIYISIFSLSSFGIGHILAGIDLERLRRSFDDSTPISLVRKALIFLSVMLSIIWLAQIGGFVFAGIVPEGVRLGGNGFIYPYVLDLGVVVPLSVLGAKWIRMDTGRGLLIAGFILVKASAMGYALLAMTGFSLMAGYDTPLELAALWVVIALGGSILSISLLRHCLDPSV
jgi:hypothetical protein